MAILPRLETSLRRGGAEAQACAAVLPTLVRHWPPEEPGAQWDAFCTRILRALRSAMDEDRTRQQRVDGLARVYFRVVMDALPRAHDDAALSMVEAAAALVRASCADGDASQAAEVVEGAASFTALIAQRARDDDQRAAALLDGWTGAVSAAVVAVVSPDSGSAPQPAVLRCADVIERAQAALDNARNLPAHVIGALLERMQAAAPASSGFACVAATLGRPAPRARAMAALRGDGPISSRRRASRWLRTPRAGARRRRGVGMPRGPAGGRGRPRTSCAAFRA